MDYSAQYQKKLTTPDEAVRCIRSGDWLDYSWCACTPDLLDQALARRLPELTDLKIRGGTCLRDPAIFQVPDGAEHFCFNSWHMTGFERRRMASGMVYYNPLRYSELPRYYREHTERVDVAMVMAAPMDEEGYFNFGPNATHMEALMKKADRILVEVNPHMIRCCGAGNRVHIDRVTAIVEGGRAMAGLPVPAATEVERQIAARIVPLIPDGATLQLGIGGLPNVVGEQLADSDLKDLGVHTEMYVDAYLALARAGKITGANKAIDRGLQIYAFGAGSQALYDYLDNNPEVQVRPVDYTNDVRVIAQIDKFISINSAVDVDLTGQVNAESAGHRHISGAGGQLDFVLGAYLSNGGKSIIACSSTFTDKTGAVHSRIRPTLTPGSAVTDTRTNLHWFVTEYGAVCLKGQATWQRAELLISVAHPDLRDQLIKEADALGFWRRSNKR